MGTTMSNPWSATPRRGRPPKRFKPTKPLPVQAPVEGKEGWLSCSLHEIHYRPKAVSTCPMCARDTEVGGLKAKIEELTNAIRLLQDDKRSLQAQLSHADAMRAAVDVMSESDRLAIKEMLYRWQRGEVLDRAMRREKFTSRNGAGTRHVVAGFTSGSDQHFCDSVGGVAIARAFSEATKVVGREEATKLVVRALEPTMAPAPEDTVD